MSTEFELCGMVRYLAKFMPNLAGDLEPIRALTEKESIWNWSRECDEALKAVKRKVTNTQVLAYFDLEKELMLRVDSSKDGLGAAILQTGRPIEFASRALTQAEQKWAQTGKKTLSLVSAMGLRVSTSMHTGGRCIFRMTTNHCMATILKKPLSQASRRIQALMMRLHRYDATDLPVCTEQPTFHCRHSEPCLSSSMNLGSMFV